MLDKQLISFAADGIMLDKQLISSTVDGITMKVMTESI